ncbi:MAG: phosphate ABC transporter permease subunit PstC [Proteobacteria bacterium]|nr:phosphate ABC transporter permease subunit PstC [Cystobacterineae bacterium]MCL2258462.1 phosphate ABC transporter permease subunit PstC [Cystobacterineae bacterium]MCL2315199.1 phosphate ABC transporter permease subunit PstC [Pseudomonadota bacterium]
MLPTHSEQAPRRELCEQKPSKVEGGRNFGDGLFKWITAGFAASAVILLAAMVMQMTRASALSIQRFGFGFLVGMDWDPVQEIFGAFPFVFGTVVSSVIALLLVIPIALGVAIFLAELAPGWLTKPLGLLVELLAAIPSIVYGLWGMFILAPWLLKNVYPILEKTLGFLPLFQGVPQASGRGMLAAGVVLAIMVLPTVASVSRELMVSVPKGYREGVLALGATRWEAIRVAVLPNVVSGIVGAIVLGFGRALGETMAVTMLIGNRAEISASLFAPAATIASMIANEYAGSSDELYLSVLTELGLVLFVLTLLLNMASKLLVWRVGRMPGVERSL